jgi:uncharacterized protein YjbI with pentapeptide repeats
METCTVLMADNEPCGRPLYKPTPVAAPVSACIMHFDGPKPLDLVQGEVNALIAGTSQRSKLGISDFSGFLFPGGVVFSEAVFSRYACFIGAKFSGPVDFSQAKFTKDANFAQARFLQTAFCNAVFAGACTFAAVRFGHRVDFGKVTMKKKADFRDSRFEGEVSFGDATLHSAVFSESEFLGRAWFGGASILEGADFQTVHFHSDADFFDAKLFGRCRFTYGRYEGDSSFSGTLLGDSDFSCSEFRAFANFYKTVFTGQASFNLTKFQDVRFDSARFDEGAEFESATFTGSAEFQNASFGFSSAHAGIADFTNARFESPNKVWLTQVNRGPAPGLRVRFVNCDVERIHLEDVRWHRRAGRMVLQDELDIDLGYKERLGQRCESPGHELVAIAYRQLIDNFDKVRSLDLAEDCYCGAMDMTRRNLGVPLVSRCVLAVYKVLSSYGSSYARALLVLVLFVLAFASVFSAPWTGLRPARDNPANVRMADSFLRRYPAGLIHALEVATFQRDTMYGLPARPGRLATIAEQVVIPIQAGLLALALRRRFRR